MIFFFSLDTPSRLLCLVIKSDQTSTYHQLPSYLVLTTRFVAGVSSCGCVVRSCKYVVVVELLGSMVVDWVGAWFLLTEMCLICELIWWASSILIEQVHSSSSFSHRRGRLGVVARTLHVLNYCDLSPRGNTYVNKTSYFVRYTFAFPFLPGPLTLTWNW